MKNSFRITLMEPSGKLNSLWLPSGQPQGLYFIKDSTLPTFYVEGINGNWYAKCTDSSYFINLGKDVSQCVRIYDRQILVVKTEYQLEYIFYIEEITKYRNQLTYYYVEHNTEISIGRKLHNDIQYDFPLVSGKHAILKYEHEIWSVSDYSSNGTYVNNNDISQTSLNIGDVIYIAGLLIIIGTDFIAINNHERNVYIHRDKLKLFDDEYSNYGKPETQRVTSFFNRKPRRKKKITNQEIIIDAPPMSLNNNQMPLFLRMGSSMVIGGSAALSGRYTMLLTSMLFPLLSNRYGKKEKEAYEKNRLQKYGEYLSNKKNEISLAIINETNVLNYNYEPIDKLLNYPDNGQRLWERRQIDDDFLTLRLGNGDVPLQAKINCPKEKFDLEEDVLENQMFEIGKKEYFLHDTAILYSFLENFVTALKGNKEVKYNFIELLLLQSIITHSFDELKIIFVGNEKDLEQFNYIRYIPHFWDDSKENRFIATDISEAFSIGEMLKDKVEQELLKPRDIKTILKSRPYYLVIALNKRIFDSMEVLKEIMKQDSNCGVSIITAFEDMPKECHSIIELGIDGSNTVIKIRDLDTPNIFFKLDNYNKYRAKECVRKISNTRLKIVSQSNELPNTVTFMEMYNAGKIEHLNPLQRWRENNPVKSLAVPVGVSPDGSLFTLDLHQKAQGPHGLIAGMTGSGKSEFIITYILSMALNFNPDEVAFLLIDYKGGGLTSSFEDEKRGIRLPHLVGTITNLDGAAINRSLVSIQSELTRRQKLFNEAKSAVGESNIDIYTYQQLYRNHQVSDPLPHLFIIADEFAEMKQQQPEFMQSLISIARIGRSLGVHLILATQKPSGVVNDQIRSNTKFRVCLKVQDKADSMDMLKRPEGAEIKETGRFYLQVGYNEYFAIGQSAWSGAPYVPRDLYVANVDESVQFIDHLGNVIYTGKEETKVDVTDKSQLTSIVEYLTELTKQMGILPRQLWKNSLPETMDLETIIKKNKGKEKYTTILGMVDDPENQDQFWLSYNPIKNGNTLIIGDAKSGKSNMLFSILYSLSLVYSSLELNYYVFNFSESLLGKLESFPHCGAMISEETFSLAYKCVSFVNDLISERKSVFKSLEISDFSELKGKDSLPLTLVAIDNAALLKNSNEGMIILDQITSMMKTCGRYGIQFIITSSHISDINFRMRQEFQTSYALHAKDKYEYGEILGCRCSFVTDEIPGRGMIQFQGRPLVMQTAVFGQGRESEENKEILERTLQAMNKKYSDIPSARPAIKHYERQTYDQYMNKHYVDKRLGLGFDADTLNSVDLPFRQFNTLGIYFGNKISILPVYYGLIKNLMKNNFEVIFIKRKNKSISNDLLAHFNSLKIIECNVEAIDQWLYDSIMEFGNVYSPIMNDYCENNQVRYTKKDTFNYMFNNAKRKAIVMEDFYDFCDNLDSNPEENIDYSQAFAETFLSAVDRYNTFVFYGMQEKGIDELEKSYIFTKINKEHVLLVGGNYDKQSIIYLDHKMSNQMTNQYDEGILLYREKLHRIFFPCGDLEIVVDEDEKDIFGGES